MMEMANDLTKASEQVKSNRQCITASSHEVSVPASEGKTSINRASFSFLGGFVCQAHFSVVSVYGWGIYPLKHICLQNIV